MRRHVPCGFGRRKTILCKQATVGATRSITFLSSSCCNKSKIARYSQDLRKAEQATSGRQCGRAPWPASPLHGERVVGTRGAASGIRVWKRQSCATRANENEDDNQQVFSVTLAKRSVLYPRRRPAQRRESSLSHSKSVYSAPCFCCNGVGRGVSRGIAERTATGLNSYQLER